MANIFYYMQEHLIHASMKRGICSVITFTRMDFICNKLTWRPKGWKYETAKNASGQRRQSDLKYTLPIFFAVSVTNSPITWLPPIRVKTDSHCALVPSVLTEVSVVYLSSSRQILGQYLKETHDRFTHILPGCMINLPFFVWRYITSVYKNSVKHRTSIHITIKCWLVAWLVGWLVGRRSFAVKAFWALWDNIYECVYCYNRYHGNAVEGYWALRDNIYDCVCLLL
jgi:hypothetical protein